MACINHLKLNYLIIFNKQSSNRTRLILIIYFMNEHVWFIFLNILKPFLFLAFKPSPYSSRKPTAVGKSLISASIVCNSFHATFNAKFVYPHKSKQSREAFYRSYTVRFHRKCIKLYISVLYITVYFMHLDGT